MSLGMFQNWNLSRFYGVENPDRAGGGAGIDDVMEGASSLVLGGGGGGGGADVSEL